MRLFRLACLGRTAVMIFVCVVRGCFGVGGRGYSTTMAAELSISTLYAAMLVRLLMDRCSLILSSSSGTSFGSSRQLRIGAKSMFMFICHLNYELTDLVWRVRAPGRWTYSAMREVIGIACFACLLWR